MSVIPESGMNFGKYDEKDLFHIETSEIYKKLGDGIPTVEFILKYNGNNIVFLEAKKSCPNVANRYESKEKEQKFEEYYGSITEKFISSLQIYLAAIMNRYQETSEIGDNLRSVSNMKDVKLKFILVVKNAEDITWLAGPLVELRARLLKVRKIWGVDVDTTIPGTCDLTNIAYFVFHATVIIFLYDSDLCHLYHLCRYIWRRL